MLAINFSIIRTPQHQILLNDALILGPVTFAALQDWAVINLIQFVLDFVGRFP